MGARSIGHIGLLVSCLFATICQLLLSSAFTIGLASPNFIAAVVLALVMLSPSKKVLTYAFIFGLVYNLVCGGPVGAMAFSITATAFVLLFLCDTMRNVSGLSVFAILGLGCLLCEMAYGFVMVLCMDGITLVDMLVLRALPCALYDFILCAVFYLVMGIVFGITSNKRVDKEFR